MVLDCESVRGVHGERIAGTHLLFHRGLDPGVPGLERGKQVLPGKETACIARGDASCEFRISREPID